MTILGGTGGGGGGGGGWRKNFIDSRLQDALRENKTLRNRIIENELGGVESFENLVRAAHERAKAKRPDAPLVQRSTWYQHCGATGIVMAEFTQLLRDLGMDTTPRNPFMRQFNQTYAGERADLYHS